jgi:aminoglycoside phosphotransferase (APT) family kinase protein
VYWGTPSDLYPFRFVGYAYLPGVPGDKVQMPHPIQDRNAQVIGDFLSSLHRFPADRAAALGIHALTGCDHAETLLDEVRGLADRMEPRLPVRLVDQCIPFLNGTVERPPPYTGQCCLTHGDLQADHILLNAEGKVSGVIDFADAGIAEPAKDYAGLCAWQGWDFARTTMGVRGLEGDETIKKRVIFMARCLGLIGVGWADPRDQERFSARLRFLQNALGG